MNFILNELSITISAHFLGANSGSSLLLEETKSSSSDSFFDKLSKESFSVSDNLVVFVVKLVLSQVTCTNELFDTHHFALTSIEKTMV